MRKILVCLIVAMTICCVNGQALIKAEPFTNKSVVTKSLPDSQFPNEVLSDVLGSFELYSSFLQDYNQIGDYQVPVHGKTQEEALDYLEDGFDRNMSQAIIEECTRWNDELQSLVINPGDGIPVLTRDDLNKISVKSSSEGKIVFLRKYNNCYCEGDEYIFLVTVSYIGQAWRISELSFTPINEGSNERT